MCAPGVFARHERTYRLRRRLPGSGRDAGLRGASAQQCEQRQRESSLRQPHPRHDRQVVARHWSPWLKVTGPRWHVLPPHRGEESSPNPLSLVRNGSKAGEGVGVSLRRCGGNQVSVSPLSFARMS